MNQPNIFIVAGPVIFEEIKGKTCTLLNKHKPSKNSPSPKWQFCGGKVENFDQTLEETAKREFKEEMNAEVTIGELIEVMMIKTDDKRTGILIHYLGNRSGEIKPGGDIQEWDWFPIDELPENLSPNIKPVINKAIKIYNK
ncbi:NUDIX hydrolase [bacterium]|jgi:ADP-ribose pyrophosphatase YjhB (NUDIX family)|nr:NUDIX hydrolase [bacterium]MBT4334945.1 NUDIX hydrolase [bacterium]MBT4495683.1 NUDIX hydrolase [bacterium]MBT4763796.1 NUDIX hydrolase [bacterium]MBT5401166.1 NUDIX hydrolase [bacterium]